MNQRSLKPTTYAVGPEQTQSNDKANELPAYLLSGFVRHNEMLQDFRKPVSLLQETQVQACASKWSQPPAALSLGCSSFKCHVRNEMSRLFSKYAEAEFHPRLLSATSQTASSPSKQLPLICVFGRLLLAGLLELTLGRQHVVARLFGRGHALW